MAADEDAVPVHRDQLAIPVPPAPEAVGRWTAEHQFDAYARELGAERALEQKRLAEEAKVCTCGAQDKANSEADDDDRRRKKIPPNRHKPGCQLFVPIANSPVRISPETQAARLAAERRGRR